MKMPNNSNQINEATESGAGNTASEKKKKKGFDLIPKIVCFLIAVAIWFYVMQVDSDDYTEVFSGVDVVLTNTSVIENERSLFVYSGYGFSVDVKVSGKKSTINKVSAEDIKVTADLSEITEAGEHRIPINVSLPTGLSLEETDYNDITVYVDEKGSQAFKITAKAIGANYSSQFEYGDLVSEYDTVIVTGPKNVIETIDYAVAEADFTSLGIIDETTSSVRSLSLIDKDGNTVQNPYLKLSRSEVKVTLPVYLEKEVPLTVSYLYGYYNEKNVNITFTPPKVTIKGDPAEISHVESITVAQIDEKAISGDITAVYTLEDTDYYSVTGEKDVSVEIKHVGTVPKTYSVENVNVTAGKNSYEILDESVDVTLRGSAIALSNIEADDIILSVDISEYSKDYSGTVKAPATVSVRADNSNGIYEIGTYSVQIKVN